MFLSLHYNVKIIYNRGIRWAKFYLTDELQTHLIDITMYQVKPMLQTKPINS